ncbi:phosphopantetheine-binding protein [Paenibacillus sp. 2KB_22]|uniref:phosphopantetheine-binding protein n=1 Tax=Paenibacillus sp. 2KB_22 TaxID=3232978 RepID=UPI003F9ABF7C
MGNNETVLGKLEVVLGNLLNTQEKIMAEESLSKWGLDSLKTIELIVILENEFDIVFDNNDLLLDNFGTINTIVSLLTRVRSS